MSWSPGDLVSRCYLRGGRRTWVQPMRVIADDEAGLLLWHPVGSDHAKLTGTDGRTLHHVPIDQLRDPRLTVHAWQHFDILVLMPPAAAHSVWWFFDEGAFRGWYVNLEIPYARRPAAVETTDQILDIVVQPDRSWQWKDEDEFAERTGHPGYFDEAGAAAIRAEGQRVITLIEAGRFPFDGTHTDFRPDPGWPRLRLLP